MATKIREGQDMDVWEPWVQKKRMRDGWSQNRFAI